MSGGWLMKDFDIENVPILPSSLVERVTVEDGQVSLRLDGDGSESVHQTFDHVIAATGHRVDIDTIAYLDESLRARVDQVEMTTVLASHFESSVLGLYFVGPVSANSVGPALRFAAKRNSGLVR